MPPRIPSLRRTFRFIVSPTVDSKSSLFLPFLLPQARNASILADLRDNTKAYSHKIKRGRGPSSGRGKTSGRGQKGQKAHGKVPSGFQGGQTPVEVVAGKRGFDNQFSVNMSKVNLDTIQSWINQGRLDPSRPITLKELVKSRCIHGIKDGVKLLGRNSTELKTPIKILVSRASASAIAAVEANGGSVTTRYYSPLAIKRVLKGDSPSEAFEPGPLPLDPQYKFRLPDPTSRKDIEYYRDPAHRGYLSHLVGEGETPSLFFRTPGKGKIATKKSVAAKAENRIW